MNVLQNTIVVDITEIKGIEVDNVRQVVKHGCYNKVVHKQINPWENAFARWLLLLPANEDEHLTQTLEEIAMNQDPILQKAMNKWERMSQDSSFRQAYEAREKALMDEAAGIAHAEQRGIEKGRKEGLKEGLQKGKEEGKMQLIRGMYKNGMAVEDIAKFTKLSVGEIRDILQS